MWKKILARSMHLTAFAYAAIATVSTAYADDPQPDSQPMSPAKSLAATHVRDGFEIELVAAGYSRAKQCAF